MSSGMRRREFLLEGGRAAVGCSLLPLVTRKQVPPAAPTSGTPSGIPELEALIQQLMREGNVPGLSIAVIKDATIAWRRAFGVKDSASQAPVDDDTVFEIASVSKTVFAYAVMQLVEKGIIGLDTPLTKYTPERFIDDPRLDLITPRRVLSHTTGFQDWRSGQEPLSIHFTPGEKFLYSGEGYYYLQSVVTRLTGTTQPQACAEYEAGFKVCATDIDQYMKAHVLTPFGMTSSGYVWNDTFERHTARPHDTNGKPLTKSKPNAIDAARYASAGGLHTTATDYARFLIEVINPGAADSFRLKKETVREMLRPQVKVDESKSWALGWQILHTKTGDLIQHEGGNKGFQAFASASVDRKSGYIAMTNSDNGWKIFYNDRFVDVTSRLLFSETPVVVRNGGAALTGHRLRVK